tara:strand:- start:1701 stop:2150 length:450 start_codon:yes stop_codon:yes gene_type:complete
MPRGKKSCPSCNSLLGARTSVCDCGHKFTAKPKKEAKPYFKERREFLKRMLGGSKPTNYVFEMHTVTKIFEQFDNDVEFLSKVKPPFELKETIKYFLTHNGKEFLNKKHREFYYKLPEKDKFVDTKEKSGEDTLENKNKKKTLRDFLYE